MKNKTREDEIKSLLKKKLKNCPICNERLIGLVCNKCKIGYKPRLSTMYCKKHKEQTFSLGCTKCAYETQFKYLDNLKFSKKQKSFLRRTLSNSNYLFFKHWLKYVREKKYD